MSIQKMTNATKVRARPGFTLTELLVGLVLSTLILSVLFGAIIAGQRNYTTQRAYRNTEEALRTAEQTLRVVLASALADPGETNTALLDPDILTAGSTFTSLRVKSDFNPPDRDFNDGLEDISVKVVADTLLVKWTVAGSFQPVGYPIRALTFEYFDQNRTPITTEAGVADARSVRFTITAPGPPGTTTLSSRQTWVFLRNRRPTS
jgi:prepilin-type N-terminal cleavage/methylation domain-containing protein